MKGNKRKKRLAKLKKKRNILKNNVSHKEVYRWLRTAPEETPVTIKGGENVIHPKDIDPDWEYEEHRQREIERDDERLQEMAERDLNR